MKKFILLSAAAMTLAAGPAFGQASTEQQTSQQDRIGAIFGALFGDRQGTTASIEAQWAAGQTPLANQRAQFEARVDTEVRSGALNQNTGAQVKSDYYALVQLESRYGADRRFTTQEQADLGDRYGALTQVLADGAYAGGGLSTTTQVADGRAMFDQRVNAALAARRISRTQSTRLKTDYAAVARIEAGYMRDGRIDDRERYDLEARLDALDVRLGGSRFAAAVLTPRARLDAIGQALPSSGLPRAARTQIQVEYEDISRLEQAYARLSVTADDRAYLDRRLAELEVRARMRTAASGF